jgi:hypothetical protein
MTPDPRMDTHQHIVPPCFGAWLQEYGSDWLHAPKARGLHFANMLDDFGLTSEQRSAIHRGNALALFPRLA